jgi:post-segregation antitoxin (ccd killing protein)
MPETIYDQSAAKTTAHLSINSDLLRQARLSKVNLSRHLEKSLEEYLREKRRQEWLENSREALEEYGRFVEKHGCFSDTLRSF